MAKTKKISKSAKDGTIVSTDFRKNHPSTTYLQTVPVKKPKRK